MNAQQQQIRNISSVNEWMSESYAYFISDRVECESVEVNTSQQNVLHLISRKDYFFGTE